MILVADAILYGFPAGAALMLAVPAILWLFWKLDLARQKAVTAFLGERLTPTLSMPRSPQNQTLRTIFIALAWMSATMALMQPEWQRVKAQDHDKASKPAAGAKEQGGSGELQRRPQDVIFLLDTSASMNVADTITGQTRFEQAKDLIADTVNRLDGGNIGLDAFTIGVKVVVPPTYDHLYLRMLLRDVQINETGLMGTDFRRVFNELKQSLWNKPSDKFITLILMTDGGDTYLESLPSDQRARYIQSILEELGDVDVNRRRIFTVGVGSSSGQPIPGVEYGGKPVQSALLADFLQQVAQVGHGAYLQANHYDGQGLSEDLAAQIAEGSPPPLPVSDGTIVFRGARTEAPSPPIPLFYVPLLLAIALLTAALVIPEIDASAAKPTAQRVVS